MIVSQAIRSCYKYKFRIAISDCRMKVTIISHCVYIAVIESNKEHVFIIDCFCQFKK